MTKQPIFSRDEIIGYYLPALRHVCQCGNVTGTTYGTEMMVELASGQSLTLRELRHRMTKLFGDKGKIPHRSTTIRRTDAHHMICEDCMPKSVGDYDCTVPFCPNEVPDTFGTVESENLDPPRRKGKKSKKLKRESEADKAERVRRNRIRKGDLSALLGL